MQQAKQADGPRRATRRAGGVAPEALSTGEAGYRRRRLAEARARRTRRAVRAALAGGGALAVLILLVLAGGLLLGGDGERSEGAASGNSAEGGPLLLLVLQESRASAAVLLGAGSSPATLLGVPAGTLVQSPAGFQTLESLWQEDAEVARQALESLLDLPAGSFSTVSWAALRDAARSAGGEADWPEALPADSQEAASLALQAVASLCGTGDQAKAAADDLGERSEGEDLGKTLGSLAGRIERAEVMPGKAVRGVDFAYYEPDVRSLRMLVADAGEGGVEVEVQNGSGVVGVTEAVTAALQPQGYRLLPVRNADDFPNVERTQVFSARDVLGEAERVRAALGVGQVVPQEGLPPGRIVVIVGNDLEPGALSVAGDAQPGQPGRGEGRG